MQRLAYSLSLVNFPYRCFSLSPKKNLARLLDKQIDHEFSNYNYDKDVAIFLHMNDLEIEDFEHTTEVILRKKINEITLEVAFRSKSPLDQQDLDVVGQATNSKITNNFCEFDVFLTYSKNYSGIYVDCTTYNSELYIKSATFAPDMNAFKKLKTSNHSYSGPELDKYHGNLKEKFLEYLSHLGISNDLCSFIETYCIDKEYRLYMAWLQKVRELLK